MVRRAAEEGASVISQVTHQEISQRLSDALGEEPRSPTSTMAAISQIMQPSLNELFFSNVVILVEGIEDVAFISTHLKLSDKWDQFRQHGCHFIMTGGKTNMSRPLAVANSLCIPAFVIFDSDADTYRENPGDHPRNNACILSLCGVDKADPMPTEPIWADNLVMWHSDISNVVQNDFGNEDWETAETKAKADHGFMDGVKRKNAMLITATLEELYGQNKPSKPLEKLCTNILAFAEKH